MTNPCCDVIGCPHAAAWRHALADVREEHLCSFHWSYLRAFAPHKSVFYIPVASEELGAAERYVQKTCSAGQSPNPPG